MIDYKLHTFILNPKKAYDHQTSLSLALACDLAYKNKAEIIDVAGAWQFTDAQFISVTKGNDIDTQCFVMSNDNHVVVAFRGSASIKDWLSNFQATREPGPLQSTFAHEGFQDALYPAVIKLTNALDDYRVKSKKLWLTGHSLGGALCSLYSAMLIENGYCVHGIYTFASPRPGDDDFAHRLNEQVVGPHHRVVNEGDIVPHVPPEPFFSHAGKRRLLKDSGTTTSSRSWFKQRVKALEVFVSKMTNAFDVVDNHTLMGDDDSYIPKLIRLAK